MKPGHLQIVLEELTLNLVCWKLRDILSRNCISEKSQTEMTFNVGESIVEPKCVRTRLFISLQCRGSKKWRWRNQSTISRRRNQLKENIS